jgi:hypothetical protein
MMYVLTTVKISRSANAIHLISTMNPLNTLDKWAGLVSTEGCVEARRIRVDLRAKG